MKRMENELIKAEYVLATSTDHAEITCGNYFSFYESGKGYWMPGVGCLRAEGENRPSRPGHVICEKSTVAKHSVGQKAVLYEPKSMKEENLTDKSVASALRAGESKSARILCLRGNHIERSQTDHHGVCYVPVGNHCGSYRKDETSATLQTRYHFGDGGDAALVVIRRDEDDLLDKAKPL